MDIKKYKAKPITIEAVQITEENAAEIAEWCGGTYELTYWIKVPTMHGIATAVVGQYVAKGTHDFYPLDPDALEARWEEVE